MSTLCQRTFTLKVIGTVPCNFGDPCATVDSVFLAAYAAQFAALYPPNVSCWNGHVLFASGYQANEPCNASFPNIPSMRLWCGAFPGFPQPNFLFLINFFGAGANPGNSQYVGLGPSWLCNAYGLYTPIVDPNNLGNMTLSPC
jgi:hypothetical protein